MVMWANPHFSRVKPGSQDEHSFLFILLYIVVLNYLYVGWILLLEHWAYNFN